MSANFILVRKDDESKDSFYEELERVFFYRFPKYHRKIILGDFNAKVVTENIFKPKIGNESLHQHSNDNGVRLVKRWAGHVARMGEGRGVYRVLVGKPEGKRPLGRPRPRWEDNIGMDLHEVGLGYEDWIGLAQDRDRWRALVSALRNLRVP